MQVSGVPWGGEHGHGRKSNPTTMGVVHNTYGQWGGDVSVVGENGSAHFVIGKEEGQWVQLADTDSVTWNCGNWDANNCSVALEFTGTSDEDLTDWQTRAGAHIIREVSLFYGIPMDYDDGEHGPVDVPPFHGWYSHRAIRPDAGSQHTDFISIPEWELMVGTSGTPAVDQPTGQKGCDMLIVETTDGVWHLVNDEGGSFDCGPGVAYALGTSGVPVVRNQQPLALIGIKVSLAKAKKDGINLLAKV
jgi:hypothetical protein